MDNSRRGLYSLRMDFDESLPAIVDIPEIIPAITLNETVLFPHALMPLYIFEPRYRKMLEDVLATDRMFAVVQEDPNDDSGFEPCFKVGTVGVIRASHLNEDGTSHLVLQGLARVKIIEIIAEEPYRQLRVEPVVSDLDAPPAFWNPHRQQVDQLLQNCDRIQQSTPKEFIEFLDSIEEAPVYLDVAIQTLCPSAKMKQILLETFDITQRFNKFISFLQNQLREEDLFRELQGETGENEIPLN